MKFNLTIEELKASEKSIFSQKGQDGILEAIFSQLEISLGTFVEFGAKDGVELSNTANLRIKKGWKGLLMDAEPLSDIVMQEFITRSNINRLLTIYKADDFDYLSIDIDGNDYWIWKEIKSQPKVVSIEYNSKFTNEESFTIEHNENHKWDGDDYYGASLLALKKLGEQKGYTLVYVVGELDAIFIKNTLLSDKYVAPKIWELFPSPIIAHEKVSNKKWVEV